MVFYNKNLLTPSKMAYSMITLAIVVAVMTTLIQAQEAQQQPEHTETLVQSRTFPYPCNSAGLQGPPGVQGPQGLVGPQGPQGLTGPAGDPGIPGVPGQACGLGQSSKGEKGDPGADGFMGPPGNEGIKGSRGDPGFRGPPGNNGVQGERGPKGEPGESAASAPMSAFSAHRTESFTMSQGPAVGIIFDAEDLDVGNDYDPATGVFTCSIQGLYYFSYNFQPWPLSGSTVYLQHNGVSKMKMTYEQGDRYFMQSQSIILSLQVGDTVKLVAEYPTVLAWTNYDPSRFNGYLIHST